MFAMVATVPHGTVRRVAFSGPGSEDIRLCAKSKQNRREAGQRSRVERAKGAVIALAGRRTY